jgi:hypothetical protein
MKQILTLLVPPYAICRYGCTGFCAAPIGVFWLTGLFGIIYGFMGGLGISQGTDWLVVSLGAGLVAIAAGWAWLAIRKAEQEEHDSAGNPVCRIFPGVDESNPFDEVKKAR